MKKRIPLIVIFALIIFAFVLEVIPTSVVMRFSPNPDREVIKYVAYWSMIPVGYGNFLCFFTFIITCLLIIFIPLYFFLKKRAFNIIIYILLVFGIILSTIPVCVYEYSTWQNYTILAAFCVNFVILLVKEILEFRK